MANAPFWKLLSAETDFWSVAGPQGGIVQLFEKGKGVSLGAFAVCGGADFQKRVRELVVSVPKTAKQLEAKVVATAVFGREIRTALSQLGVSTMKVVEREGTFEIRFSPKDQKLMVSASGPADAVEAAPVAAEPAPAPAVAAAPVPAYVAEKRKIRALIVDDSPTICKILEKILSSDPEIEVMAAVGLPSQVEAAIQKHRPDVITLDIHLPEMNGVELLKKYLPRYRVPTVMISSISMEEGPLVLNALEAGAVDYVQKPSAGEIAAVSPVIIGKVKMAAAARLHVPPAASSRTRVAASPGSVDMNRMIVIGSSTGGTEALKEVFVRLPENIPPILVVQHIPSVFSKAFADRLNQLCPFEVVEGQDGDVVKPNKIIIAPGGKQMRIKKSGSGYTIVVDDSEPVNRHKPSVDVLFDSVVKLCGPEVVGVILTGMGADGAKGLLALKQKGCFTIGQDEASCVVYGMPQAAFKLGATEKMVPLLEIPAVLMREVSQKRKERKAG